MSNQTHYYPHSRPPSSNSSSGHPSSLQPGLASLGIPRPPPPPIQPLSPHPIGSLHPADFEEPQGSHHEHDPESLWEMFYDKEAELQESDSEDEQADELMESMLEEENERCAAILGDRQAAEQDVLQSNAAVAPAAASQAPSVYPHGSYQISPRAMRAIPVPQMTNPTGPPVLPPDAHAVSLEDAIEAAPERATTVAPSRGKSLYSGRDGRTGTWDGQELHDLVCSIEQRQPHLKPSHGDENAADAWILVSMDLGSARTAQACEKRFKSLVKAKEKPDSREGQSMVKQLKEPWRHMVNTKLECIMHEASEAKDLNTQQLEEQRQAKKRDYERTDRLIMESMKTLGHGSSSRRIREEDTSATDSGALSPTPPSSLPHTTSLTTPSSHPHGPNSPTTPRKGKKRPNPDSPTTKRHTRPTKRRKGKDGDDILERLQQQQQQHHEELMQQQRVSDDKFFHIADKLACQLGAVTDAVTRVFAMSSPASEQGNSSQASTSSSRM
ncbi:hypothetical protein C8Q80DRAFT_1272942 [Daedaleopsis nitida]|nr:hypothetical protein C8Q80DRAFT_1272942 [Daedaleopsis nitida]